MPVNASERNSAIFSQPASSPVNKEAERLSRSLDLEEMGHEEYSRMLQIFKEIDFAHGKAIHMLF